MTCDNTQYNTCSKMVAEATTMYCQEVNRQSCHIGCVRCTNLTESTTKCKAAKKTVIFCARRKPCLASPPQPFQGDVLVRALSPSNGWHVEFAMSRLQISVSVNPNMVTRTAAVKPNRRINSTKISHRLENRSFVLLGIRVRTAGSRGVARNETMIRGIVKSSNQNKCPLLRGGGRKKTVDNRSMRVRARDAPSPKSKLRRTEESMRRDSVMRERRLMSLSRPKQSWQEAELR